MRQPLSNRAAALGRFLSKEPTTIVWLEIFARDEVLIDVGANGGRYYIHGAMVGARVFAFEPVAAKGDQALDAAIVGA
jgi:hypothetical protein